MNKLLIFISISLIPSISVAGPTLFDLPQIEQNAEQKADLLFEEGNYKKSFELYLSLAKLGDKYSQYMVSVQYLNGVGVQKDMLQAYGWASLAKRSKTKEVEDYYLAIESQIDPQDKQNAEDIRMELSEKYSDLAIAMRLKRMIRNTIPECGGSRIRGNCSFIKHYCVDGGSQQSYENCLREVSLRDPKVIRALKQDLAKTDTYIENKLLTGGTVTVEEVNSSEEERSETEEK